MGFRLTPRSMTLDDLELKATTAKRTISNISVYLCTICDNVNEYMTQGVLIPMAQGTRPPNIWTGLFHSFTGQYQSIISKTRSTPVI